MIELQVKDNKAFMNHVLKLDTFDKFLLKKAELDISIAYRIFGDLIDEENQNIAWGDVREDFFFLIKGKPTPKTMKIILGLDDSAKEKIADEHLSDINDFTLMIVFDGTSSKLITGVNYKNFILDKTVEKSFDDNIYKFLDKKGISFN